MSFKVTDFSTNRKRMYDFLSVINTNLPPILHRLRDRRYSLRDVKKCYIWLPLLHLNPPTEGFLWDDLRKIFSECQWMAKVPNGVEILLKISTRWVGRTNVTDNVRYRRYRRQLRGGLAVKRWTCDLRASGSIPAGPLSRNIGKLSLASLPGR